MREALLLNDSARGIDEGQPFPDALAIKSIFLGNRSLSRSGCKRVATTEKLMRHGSTLFAEVRAQSLAVVLLAVCSTIGAFPVYAAGQSEKEGAPCGSETTTAAMVNCENLRYQQAQQALDSVYTELMKQFDETGKMKLRTVQSAWVRFRRADSDFEGDVARDGTLAPLIRVTVLADMTEARTRELKKSVRP